MFYRNRYLSGDIPQIDNGRRGGVPGRDQYTKLLLHCDGLQESGAFIDSSLSPHPVNPGGGMSGTLSAYVDNSQSVFGGFSCNMVGNTSRYLSLTDHADWSFGTGDFTIDFRLRFSNLHTGTYSNYLFGQYADVSNYWYLRSFIRAGAPSTVTINAAGSNYSVGDTLTIVQAGGSGAKLRVDSLAGSGVAGVTIIASGTAYSVANGLATTVNPNVGSGCKINITAIVGYMVQTYGISGGVAGVNWNRPCSLPINTWYHFALVRSGNTHYMFVDGVMVCASYQTDAGAYPDVAAPLTIGQLNYTSNSSVDGWMDEIRISKGIARWTANFTPPTMAYI